MRARLSEPGGRGDLSGWALVVLDGIRSGHRAFSAVRHPLGFTCVQLYRDAGWGLCLHVWTSGDLPPELTTSPVHAHSWDLASQVVCGQLDNVVMRVSDSVFAPTHRVLEITSAQGTDTIRPTARLVSCRRDGLTRVGPGQNYSLPAGTFHLSRPDMARPAVTLLLAEDREQSPELALGRLDTAGHSVSRQPCSSRELRRMATMAVSGVSRSRRGGSVIRQFRRQRIS